jgi:hypothetical protein
LATFWTPERYFPSLPFLGREEKEVERGHKGGRRGEHKGEREERDIYQVKR